MQQAPQYDVRRMQHDMAGKGWQLTDLARRARVDKATVSRFFAGTHRTTRTASKLAKALGYSVRRYLVPLELSA